jgi:hypothetical protein
LLLLRWSSPNVTLMAMGLEKMILPSFGYYISTTAFAPCMKLCCIYAQTYNRHCCSDQSNWSSKEQDRNKKQRKIDDFYFPMLRNFWPGPYCSMHTIDINSTYD